MTDIIKIDRSKIVAAIQKINAEIEAEEAQETEYIYMTDETGAPTLKKVRRYDTNGKKTFRWMSRADSGDRWTYGRPQGVTPPLYTNQKPLEGADVFIVEGEKDVDTLTALGLAAASLPDGAAGSKWCEEYSQALSDKDVIIIPDNDPPGIQYAEMCAESVHESAKSVKILYLCNLWDSMPPKADITDYIKADGISAIETVLKAVEHLPEYEPQEATTESEPKPPDCFFENGRFHHELMARHMINNCGVVKIDSGIGASYGAALHIYKDGVYISGENTIHGAMIDLMPTITEKQRREVYSYLVKCNYVEVKKRTPAHLIPFKSKVYNLERNSFLEYIPEYVFLNKFPYDYNLAAAPAPKVEESINAIADGDTEIINLIYETIGYCFLTENRYRAAVMLYGNGKNGKSTLLNMIAQVIGAENASYLSLHDVSERFKVIDLYCKAVNIGDDLNKAYLPETGVFKSIVTGGTITAEHKGEKPISFTPYAKMFFACNELPPTNDKSSAYYGRILPIPLQHDFSESGDPGMLHRVWTQQEMEYLTAKAMEGLKRLIRQGDFTKPDSVKALLAEYELENNPIQQFLNDFKMWGNEIAGMPTAKVYDNYIEWCTNNGYKLPVTQAKFSREICQVLNLTTKSVRTEYNGRFINRVYVSTT